MPVLADGSPQAMLAPDRQARIEAIVGHAIALLDQRINGRRVVQSDARLFGPVSSIDTYVFDGAAYRRVAHEVVDECGLALWHARMRSGR